MTQTKEERRESIRKAIKKYDAKHDRINCRFPSGTVERIKGIGYASANSFIISAVLARLEEEEKRLNKAQNKKE